jgi:hypothetical protein
MASCNHPIHDYRQLSLAAVMDQFEVIGVTFFLLITVHVMDYHWDRHFTLSSTPITHRL